MKIIRFEITAVFPADNTTQEKIEENINDALAGIGSRFTAWRVEDEPRLLTPDELRALPRCAIVWIEYFDGELQKSNEGIIAAFKCQDGKFVDEIMCYYDDFEKDMTPDPDGSCWRFWSAEPSDELRKATPWM